MTPTEVRLACLQQAVAMSGSNSNVIQNAEAFLTFVTATEKTDAPEAAPEAETSQQAPKGSKGKTK